MSASAIFFGIASLAAAVATLSNKPLTLTFFTFSGLCFLIFFVQIAQKSNMSNMRAIRRPLLEENPTELFGGFFKHLK